jgi:hypothetical protein
MQCGRPDQQICKGKDDSSLRLPASDPSRALRDLVGKWMHSQGGPKVPQKGMPPMPLGFRARSLDAVGQFDDGYRRQSSPGFAPYLLDLLQYFRDALP